MNYFRFLNLSTFSNDNENMLSIPGITSISWSMSTANGAGELSGPRMRVKCD